MLFLRGRHLAIPKTEEDRHREAAAERYWAFAQRACAVVGITGALYLGFRYKNTIKESCYRFFNSLGGVGDENVPAWGHD